MTLLELLAGAAPARVVAADLLLLVHVPRLDLHRQVEHLLLGVVERPCGPCRCSCRQRARLVSPAAVLERPRAALLLEAVRALVLDLHVVDVARELLPD